MGEVKKAKRTGGRKDIFASMGLTGSRLTEQDRMDRNVKKKDMRIIINIGIMLLWHV